MSDVPPCTGKVLGPVRRAPDSSGSLNDAEGDDSELNVEDPNDGGYEPRLLREQTVGAPNPKKRNNPKSSVSSRTKGLPNHGVCLLTNAPYPVIGRQFCHIISHRTTDRTVCLSSKSTQQRDIDLSMQLAVLEWKWNLDYRSLCIDTRFNLVACTFPTVLMLKAHHTNPQFE